MILDFLHDIVSQNDIGSCVGSCGMSDLRTLSHLFLIGIGGHVCAFQRLGHVGASGVV